MIKVGLTGGFGSGKSLVADIYRQQDVPIIDADLIARELVEPSSPQFKEIIDAFGPELVLENGHIDRDQLAHIVFNDESSRQQLNGILHPAVMETITMKLRNYQTDDTECVIIDVPLLYETKMESLMDKIIVVWASEANCIERLIRFRGFSEQDVRRRIESQLALEEKKSRADYVIDNSGSIEETRKQALKVLATLQIKAIQSS